MSTVRIEKFLSVLKKADCEQSIKAICDAELNYLRGKHTLASVRTTLTKYRNAIRQQNPNCPSLKHLKISAAEQAELEEMAEMRVYDKLAAKRKINPHQLIARALDLLRYDTYSLLTVGLALLTGRRPTELLMTAAMRSHPHNKNMVIFSGQLKTKGSKKARTSPYAIPVLADNQIIISALRRLRTLVDFSGARTHEVHAQTANNLFKCARRHFGDLIENATVKDLRAAYATIAHHKFAPEHIDEDRYYAEILGHSIGDVITAQSYKAFYITVQDCRAPGRPRRAVPRKSALMRERPSAFRVR